MEAKCIIEIPITHGDVANFAVGMSISIAGVPSRWSRFKAWVRVKVFRRKPPPKPFLIVTAVDPEAGTITFDG